MLGAEEYVALQTLADEAGLSQSALLRMLLRREIQSHAERILRAQLAASPAEAQD